MSFTEEQLAELRAPLAREHIKQREQAGRKFSYIEGWHVIAEANRIFGFDAWDRETVEIKCVAENPTIIGQQKREGFRVGYICKVRVKVRTREEIIVREGCGYGSGIDVDLGQAHESALKEAETDAMKRALMTFGNPMGLALYDKDQANVEAPASRPTASHPAARPISRPIEHQPLPDATEPPEISDKREAEKEQFFHRESYRVDPDVTGWPGWDRVVLSLFRYASEHRSLDEFQKLRTEIMGDFEKWERDVVAPPVVARFRKIMMDCEAVLFTRLGIRKSA